MRAHTSSWIVPSIVAAAGSLVTWRAVVTNRNRLRDMESRIAGAPEFGTNLDRDLSAAVADAVGPTLRAIEDYHRFH